MFFSCVRQRGGWNNNPSAAQFRQAYRKQLVHAGVQAPNSANVAADLEGESLTVSQGTINPALDAGDDQEGDDLAVVYGLGEGTLSEFTSEVVKYIGGFVSRQVTKTLSCPSCVSMLLDDSVTRVLITIRDNGGLVYPSELVCQLLQETEKIFRVATEVGTAQISATVLTILAYRAFYEKHAKSFQNQVHVNDEPMHAVALAKAVIKKYVTLRLRHLARTITARRRRFWVRPSWRFRNTEGQASALLPRLRARDEGYFRDFLRMPPSTFDTLLGLVGPKIERKVTPFREPISPHDRLAITLRFLANGDTFRSLSYNFLIDLQKYRSDPAQYQEYLKRATFNYRLSRTRRLIENSFGIMANRWRILRRAFKASEEITESVVKACVTLHNFLLKDSAHSRSAYSPPGYTDHEDWEGKLIDGEWKNDRSGQPGLRDLAGVGLRPARTALAVRDQLASYFMNDGKVEWQDKIVTR
ncbi:hypothetical protein HPB47_021782, partial [Ixodes persulcatus]